DQRERRHALRQRVAVAAVGAENDVVRPQVGGHADRDRLLADVSVAGPVDEPALVRPGELLLARADQRHLSIQADEFGGRRQVGHAVGPWASARRTRIKLTYTPPAA